MKKTGYLIAASGKNDDVFDLINQLVQHELRQPHKLISDSLEEAVAQERRRGLPDGNYSVLVFTVEEKLLSVATQNGEGSIG
jgi:hypothetical protein